MHSDWGKTAVKKRKVVPLNSALQGKEAVQLWKRLVGTVTRVLQSVILALFQT